MGSAFHQLCPRYSGTLTPTAPTATKLWDTFTFTFFFSHCKVEQKKTVAISQMFSHVQLHVHGMHLLNNRICRYTYSINTTLL